MGLKNISAVIIFALALALLPAPARAQTIETLAYAPIKDAGSTVERMYRAISVKSRASFATDTGSVLVINNLRANTPHLTIQADNLTFLSTQPPSETRSDVFVRNDFLTGQTANLNMANLNVGGYFYSRSNTSTSLANNPINLVNPVYTYDGVRSVAGGHILMSERIQLLPSINQNYPAQYTNAETVANIGGASLKSPMLLTGILDSAKVNQCKVQWVPVCARVSDSTIAPTCWAPGNTSTNYKVLVCR